MIAENQKTLDNLKKNRRLRLERNFKEVTPMRNYPNTLKRHLLNAISQMQKELLQYTPNPIKAQARVESYSQ